MTCLICLVDGPVVDGVVRRSGLRALPMCVSHCTFGMAARPLQFEGAKIVSRLRKKTGLAAGTCAGFDSWMRLNDVCKDQPTSRWLTETLPHATTGHATAPDRVTDVLTRRSCRSDSCRARRRTRLATPARGCHLVSGPAAALAKNSRCRRCVG